MGWYYSESNKQAVIDECTKAWKSDDGNRLHHTLAKSVRGNTLYAVHEVLTYENGKEESERYIGVYLIGRSGMDWGYKPMDESMGPCYYDCPLSFFKLAPIVPGGYAAEWREKVRQYHAKKAVKRGAKVGDTVVFKPGVKFQGHILDTAVVTQIWGSKVMVKLFGQIVRVMPKHIERIERA